MATECDSYKVIFHLVLKTTNLHCVKHAGIWVFTDPYISIYSRVYDFDFIRQYKAQRKPVQR